MAKAKPKWVVSEESGGKKLVLQQQASTPMAYRGVKTWIGWVVMFLTFLLVLALVARDWFG